MRSRSAATYLLGAGLKNVYNMEGGIRAWNGMVARGLPEAGMAYFTPAANAFRHSEEEIRGTNLKPKYTSHLPGTQKYRDFWLEERKRCSKRLVEN